MVLTAGPCHWDWSDVQKAIQLKEDALKDQLSNAAGLVSQAADQFHNIVNTPGGAGCLAKATGGGALVGFGTGAATGLVGVVGGPVVLVTEPGAMIAGTAGGAGGGFILGMTFCPGGASSGGGGGGNTIHGNKRAGERNFTQADIDEAKKTAEETGNVTTQTGKYGTPQKVYHGTNGLTVVEETAGRNQGKIITGWWR
jgi:hypothetical protein